MRKQQIFPNTIIEATIKLVAQTGLETISTRKIAATMGIAEGSIFNYFPTKQDLLAKSLYYVDNEIDNALRKVRFSGFSIEKNIKSIWYAYFNFLITHGDYAKFYRQIRHSHYYTEEVVKAQSFSFVFFTNFIFKNMSAINLDPDVFWVYMIESTLNFAIRVVDKQLSGEPEDIDKLYHLLMGGVHGVLKKNSKLEV